MIMNEREKIIRDYIEGYNQFDVDKMVAHFDANITFENIQNGEVNMSLNGLTAFLRQAEQAKSYFEKRNQNIISIRHAGDETEIDIEYIAVLAKDFPNGLKRGQRLQVVGKSVFRFSADNKVIKLTDIS